MPTRYDNRKTRRQSEQWRRLGWESLDAFHARETAKPPTLAEVYRSHPKVRCARTPSLFTGHTDTEAKTPLNLFDPPKESSK